MSDATPSTAVRTPNATPAAARAGWELFRLSGFTATQYELSVQLAEVDLSAVSDRMYRHYHRLAAAGYDHYVSINRFDIARASQPFEDETASNRYMYVSVSRLVRLTVIRDGEPYEVMSQSERVSEAGAVLIINDEPSVAGLRDTKLKPGEYLRLEFLNPPVTIHSRIAADVEVVEDPISARIEVEFSRLRPVSEFIPARPLDHQRMAIRVLASDTGTVPLDVLGRRIFYLFEGLEVARSLVNEIISSEGDASTVFAQPFSVERLGMESPIEVLIEGAPAVVKVFAGTWTILLGVTALAQKVQNIRLTGAQVTREKEEARRLRLDSDRIEDENDTSRLIQLRTREALAGQVELSPTPLEISSRFLNLEKQITKNVEGLLRQEVEGLEIRDRPHEPSDAD